MSSSPPECYLKALTAISILLRRSHTTSHSVLVPGHLSKIQFQLRASICKRRLQRILWSGEQMRFHLVVNKVEMPRLSPAEMTLVFQQACYIACCSWRYCLLITSVYTFPFSLDFRPLWLAVPFKVAFVMKHLVATWS